MKRSGASCQTGNYWRRVSYGCGTQRPHAAPVISSTAKRSREISCLKGFLWLWHAAAPCRSRHFERSEAESRNLLLEGFPMAVTRSGPKPPRHFERSEAESRNLLSERFPMVMAHIEPMPDRKLYENKNPLLHGEDFLISYQITGRIWRRFRPRASAWVCSRSRL